MPRAWEQAQDLRFKATGAEQRLPAIQLLHHLWWFATGSDRHPLDVVPSTLGLTLSVCFFPRPGLLRSQRPKPPFQLPTQQPMAPLLYEALRLDSTVP